MSQTTGRIGKAKAMTAGCALAYAVMALAILATTSAQPRAPSDATAGPAPLGQRLLGR